MLLLTVRVSLNDITQSLRPFLKEPTKLTGKIGDRAWRHRRHVLCAFGFKALEDGREFLNQLARANRSIQSKNSILEALADLFLFGLAVVGLIFQHAVKRATHPIFIAGDLVSDIR